MEIDAVVHDAPGTFLVYTDGAALVNPGPGGSAFTIQKIETGEQIARAYGQDYTTNNRMELLAVVKAVSLLPPGSRIEVRTDSMYVLHAYRRLAEYEADGWRRRNRKGVHLRLFHHDLLLRFWELCQTRTVTMVKVVAHGNDAENNRVDGLAGEAALWARRSGYAHAAAGRPVAFPGQLPFPQIASFVVADSGVEDDSVDPAVLEQAAREENRVRQLRGFATEKIGWHGRRLRFGSGYKCEGRSLRRNIARRSTRVDLHQGTCRDFVVRFQRAAHRAATRLTLNEVTPEDREFFRRLFEYATDFRMLKAAWLKKESEGSLAAGVDRRTFCSYGRGERNAAIRRLSVTMRDGTWRPSRLRRILLPKENGQNRPIDIPTVEDRIVETALNMALSPVLDRLMTEHSVGFRPERSIFDGLAMAAWYAEHRGSWHFVAMDLQTAFTLVPKDRLNVLLRKYVPSSQLVDLLALIVDRRLPSGKGIVRKRGLPQGGPLSPLLLNLFLTFSLDRPWTRSHSGIPLIRYADDLLLLVPSAELAQETVWAVTDLLRPTGMRVKGNTCLANLATGEEVPFLGYTLWARDGKLRLAVSDDVWPERERALAEVSHHEAIVETAMGWLDHAGPSYDPIAVDPARVEVLWRLRALLRSNPKAPVLPDDILLARLQSASRQWNVVQSQIGMRMAGLELPGGLRLPGAPTDEQIPDCWARHVRELREASQDVAHGKRES